MNDRTGGFSRMVRSSRSSPTARTVALTMGLAVAGAVLGRNLLGLHPAHAGLAMPWWALAVLFATTETFVFHLEIHHEAHSFSFSEVPLVVALFFASPVALVVGRLVGEVYVLVLRERQAPLKVALNLVTFSAECVVAIGVYRMVAADASLLGGRSWLAAFVAVALADFLSVVVVSLAIVWHGGRPRWSSVAVAAGATLTANTSLAVLASVLLSVAPLASVLFVAIAAVLCAAYRGYSQLAQRYSSLQLLYDFTRMVGDATRADAAIESMLAQARRLLRADVAEIVLIEDGDAQLRWQMGEDEALVCPASHDPEAAAFLKGLAALQVSALSAKNTKDAEARRRAQLLGVKDCIIAPLRSQGSVLGLIIVANRLGDVSTFDASDQRLFETLANHASVALENGRLLTQLRKEAAEREHDSLHDTLTSLPNRELFQRRVSEATKESAADGRIGAVLLMDLDRFKEVNDTLGHHNGDLLLQHVAARLLQVVPPTATVSRLGGDEFAVLLPKVDTAPAAKDVAQRICDALVDPFTIEELTLEVRGSIGIALWPEHGTDVATLLKRADVAMYMAKTEQTGLAMYDNSVDTNSPRRLSLAAELSQAIDMRELIVYYQPKAHFSDGLIVGTEALVRWNHPTHGFIGPDEFIPLAETTGIIRPLTSYVLRDALERCRDWERLGYDLTVAVNLAVRSLHDNDLPNEVERLLAETGVSAHKLTLEITESHIMSDTARTTGVLDRLAALGVKLSIDDFGTGYSSLAYLQRLPVNEVKIDRGFVIPLSRNPDDVSIVRSVIELGHSLGLRVVAEGVEDHESWEILRTMGCDIAQGYHLGRPMPPADLEAWMAEHAPYFRSQSRVDKQVTGV